MIREACKYQDPELFFPLGYGDKFKAQINEALAVCYSCFDREDCLMRALSTPEKFGIWGGTTEEQRRDMVGGYKEDTMRRCYGCEHKRPIFHFRRSDRSGSSGRNYVGMCAGCENRPVLIESVIPDSVSA